MVRLGSLHPKGAARESSGRSYGGSPVTLERSAWSMELPLCEVHPAGVPLTLIARNAAATPPPLSLAWEDKDDHTPVFPNPAAAYRAGLSGVTPRGRT